MGPKHMSAAAVLRREQPRQPLLLKRLAVDRYLTDNTINGFPREPDDALNQVRVVRARARCRRSVDHYHVTSLDGPDAIAQLVYEHPIPDLKLKHQLLHAHALTLRHPSTGEEICVSAPLPPALIEGIQLLSRL